MAKLTGESPIASSATRTIDVREAIIAALAHPKTPKELKAEIVTRQGVSNSTYHYTLKQMTKRGEIAEPKYSYKGQRVSEIVVQDLLKGDAATEGLQLELSRNLVFLATKPGIVLSPLFLSKTEQFLGSKLAEVCGNALFALSRALSSLREEEYEDDKRAREIVIQRFFGPLAEIVKQNDSDQDIRNRAIVLLAELGDPRAIPALASLIESSNEEYARLKAPLEKALVGFDDPPRRNLLVRDHHSKILAKLSEMAAHGNGRASDLAKTVRLGP